MTTTRPSAFRRYCAAIVAVGLALQPLGGYAVPITSSLLAESPLQGTNPVKPNIMFTLDDSSSMNNDYTPDFTSERRGMCRDGLNCGQTPGPNGTIFVTDPPLRSSAFNTQYYDPTADSLPGVTAAGTTLPCEGADPTCGTPWTSVYVNGYAGYPGANSGPTINLVTSYPDTVFCNSLASRPPTATEIATAQGDGSICRLNGRPYGSSTDSTGTWTMPAVTAGYNYPNGRDLSTGGFTSCAVGQKCVFGSIFAGLIPVIVPGNPFYYTISNVQFCKTADASGFGILGSATDCAKDWDANTYKFVRYGTDPSKTFDPQAFTRVDILPSGFLVNGVPAANPSGRSYAAEMANFAKWYAFNRTRLLAIKTAAGRGFGTLDVTNARVGLHTLAENNTLFQNVAAFDASQKNAWFNKLYLVDPPPGTQTPLPDAVARIGEYFTAGGNSGLSGAVSPYDPQTAQCQRNYHLLATDGYWNQPLTLGAVGDQDQIVPATPSPVAGFTPGSPFPRPYYEGPNASSNSLADLAMKYWITDLQPGLPDNVPDKDAPWQHLTLYGVSIGARGNIDYPSGIVAIQNGTQDWPVPTGAGTPDSIDDLWHAAVNSRGDFANAANPLDLARRIVKAVTDFIGPSGTGTGVGIAGPQLTSTQSFAYKTSYDSKWAGDLSKYAIDPQTGAIPSNAQGVPNNPPVWSAQAQLDAQALGTGWNTNRRIITLNDQSNAVVAFRSGNLSPSQQASLIAGWTAANITTTAQQVVDYLRGDKSNEGGGASNFRTRDHALGDIVYSGAVAVGAPSEPYDDSGNPGFQSFATTNAGRTAMVYVGANDGMMHAFDDSATANAGMEAWAYVPKAVFSNGDPNDTNHSPSPAFQIGALTYQQGGIPLFVHKFYVNATPRIWDVDLANTNTSTPPRSGNSWRTLLVGGLGAGGRGVFALDVTNPVTLNDTEANVAASGRALWEFTDPNMGYLYDSPTLVKTLGYGWVVLVVSGYNNPGGQGILYVLNPADGSLIQKLSTGVGSDTTPSGLSTIRAFTQSRKDPYVLQAYGGDLQGNVWRFDLSDPDKTKWKVERFAKLVDDAGTPQPITTGIRIEVDQNNNVDRYIFVGTGKLLGPGDPSLGIPSDIDDTSVRNSIYVIRDGTVTAPDPAPSTPYSRADLNRVTPGVAGFSGPATGRGWFQDAPLANNSEKIGVDVYADVQTVVYAFSKPNPDPCLGVLTSTLYARDFTSGASVLEDGNAGVVPSIDIGPGIAGIALIQGEGPNASSAGDVRVQVTTLLGQVFSFGVALTGGSTTKHRVSWRLINR